MNNEFRLLLLFLARLSLASLPLWLIILTGYQSRLLMDATTQLALALLGATGMQPSLLGDTISIPVEGGTWGAYVSWDSTGWKSVLAFVALVAATDAVREKKLRALLLVPLIYLATIVRIWFMFFAVRTFGVSSFPALHLIVWSWGLIAFVLMLWVFWMKRM